MRLLALAPTGFFADYGCHIRIMGQLQALQQLGYQIRLVTYPAGRNLPGLSTIRPPAPFSRNLPVGSSWRKILLDALLAPTALAAALRFRPHLIHAYLHEGALIGWLLARLLRVPLTFDYQGSLTAEMLDHHFLSPRSPLLEPLRRLEAWIEQRPQAIFPSSAHAVDLLTQRGLPPARLHLLPDAIDPDFFAPRPPDLVLRRQLDLPPDGPLVVYLGLLAPYQGIDLLLQALTRPPLATHPAHFLIMGFPHVEHYRRLAHQLGLGQRTHFTGPIPYHEAPRYLALGDLAIAAKLSATEGSGKLLPYMSLALPIIATDTPVHREYLGHGDCPAGILAAPQPDALAQTIVAALDRLPDLRAHALHLRQKVQTHYTWQHNAHLIDAIFVGMSRQVDK